jgi:hypothetical protein
MMALPICMPRLAAKTDVPPQWGQMVLLDIGIFLIPCAIVDFLNMGESIWMIVKTFVAMCYDPP